MEQYISDKKILGVTEIEKQTPAGNKMVEVIFEDNSKEVMPKMRFDIIVSDEISNASKVQEVISSTVGSYLLGVLHEYGIKMGEADNILNATGDAVNVGYEKARDLKWGISHRFLPLLDVNDVLRENYAKQNSDGTSSTGSGSNQEN
jgi:hypothetical protein